MKNLLPHHQIAPKWLVFAIDLAICAVAVALADLLRFNFDLQAFSDLQYSFSTHLLLIAVTNSIVFYFTRTYQGIIRFSGLTEVLQTIGALALSLLLLLLLHALMASLHLNVLIPASVLVMYFFIASFLMAGYRLLVKNLYRRSLFTGQTNHVVIYGGGLYGARLKNIIEQSSNYMYRVVAFVDTDPEFVGKTIDKIRIYDFEQLKHHLENQDIAMLLFAEPGMDQAAKNKIVEYCLRHNIRLKNVPPVEEWIHGHLSLAQLKEVKIEELLGRPPIDLKNTAVESFLQHKRVLITGAAGSIGSEIARQVAAISPTLLVLADQHETGLHDLEYELKSNYPACPQAVIYVSDIRDLPAMENLFERFKPAIVFHAAAYKHVPIMEFHPSEAIRNNVLGTKVLADLSIRYGVERFLLISTDKAINPTNIMGASKRLAEIYVQSLGHRNRKVVHGSGPVAHPAAKIPLVPAGTTRFITTRFGNVLGSNGSVLARFKEQIAGGGPVTVTDPEIIRYFMTISEACSLVLEAVTMGKGGEIFLFDMGEPVKILDLARKMIRLSGLTPGKDIPIQFTGLRPGEKLYEELLNKKEMVIPTHHKKILIAKVAAYDFYEIHSAITDLIEAAVQNRDEEVVRKMKRLLPEFVSKNSLYTSFDEVGPNDLAASH